MYKIGSKVIYKGNVCFVKEIKEKYYNDINYYFLSPINDKSLTIKVPTNSNCIRKALSKQKALELIDDIKNVELLDLSNEKKVENVYKKLFNDETYIGLIKIIKTSFLRNQDRINNNKKASDKDIEYFEKSEQKLYNELAISLDMPFDEVKKMIIKTCNNK